jgi:hypothetical protein
MTAIERAHSRNLPRTAQTARTARLECARSDARPRVASRSRVDALYCRRTRSRNYFQLLPERSRRTRQSRSRAICHIACKHRSTVHLCDVDHVRR